jgi:hypothetical protein
MAQHEPVARIEALCRNEWLGSAINILSGHPGFFKIRTKARLACFLKFEVNGSSFSGSKVEFLAASFDLLVDTVKCLAERGGGLRSGVENIGKFRAKKPSLHGDCERALRAFPGVVDCDGRMRLAHQHINSAARVDF